jgi:YVTN family beta-propeller protein
MRYLKLGMALAIWALLYACEEEQTGEPSGFRYGVFILNEGSYGSNNGSVSYYNPDSGKLVNNLFESVNGRPLGDVVQSMGIAGDKGYIVVNGSGKVEVVDLKTFKTVSEPILASYPRFFLQAGPKKGYLSNGNMQGCIYIIDTENDMISDSIVTGYGPETMVKLGDYIYVANSGGWGLDSTVYVIDTQHDRITDTIYVGDVPVDLVVDADDNLWVYCKGYAVYNWDPPYNIISETDAKLVKINTTDNSVMWEGSVGRAGDYTGTTPKLATGEDGMVLYYLRPDGVRRINTLSPAVPGELVLEGSYYGLDTNPEDGKLYVFQSSFTGDGTLHIVDTETGYEINYSVGIGPNGAVFNLE